MGGLGADCCLPNNTCYQCTAEEAQQFYDDLARQQEDEQRRQQEAYEAEQARLAAEAAQAAQDAANNPPPFEPIPFDPIEPPPAVCYPGPANQWGALTSTCYSTPQTPVTATPTPYIPSQPGTPATPPAQQPTGTAQPPVIQLVDQATSGSGGDPAAGNMSPFTGAGADFVNWLQSKHTVGGYQIPTWAFLAAAGGAFLMMSGGGGSPARADRRRGARK